MSLDMDTEVRNAWMAYAQSVLYMSERVANDAYGEWYAPADAEAEYDRGYDAGREAVGDAYKDGYDEGYDDGYAIGRGDASE